MINAIVFTSNSGYTKKYAELLGEKTSLPVYSAKDAKKNLKTGEEIIYLGWLMASGIKGYKAAAKKYRIAAVCGVGMGSGDGQSNDIKKANSLPESLPLFVLQGGFNIDKLHGIYKFMMKTVRKFALKGLSEKADKTAEDLDMLDLMQNGGDRVKPENLTALISWYEKQE